MCACFFQSIGVWNEKRIFCFFFPRIIPWKSIKWLIFLEGNTPPKFFRRLSLPLFLIIFFVSKFDVPTPALFFTKINFKYLKKNLFTKEITQTYYRHSPVPSSVPYSSSPSFKRYEFSCSLFFQLLFCRLRVLILFLRAPELFQLCLPQLFYPDGIFISLLFRFFLSRFWFLS